METENPLFEIWRETFGERAAYSYWSRERQYDDFDPDRIVRIFGNRDKAIKRYAFAVPSPEALTLIAAFSPIVEIGAGTGYWAKLLREYGADVAAYDRKGESWKNWFPDGDVGGVAVGGIEQAELHADRTLFLCWPPYGDSFAYQCLRRYEAAGGQRLCYIGEGVGGCTADGQFFCALGQGCDIYADDEHDHATDPVATWKRVAEMDIPQWEGIHDMLAVYERI